MATGKGNAAERVFQARVGGAPTTRADDLTRRVSNDVQMSQTLRGNVSNQARMRGGGASETPRRERPKPARPDGARVSRHCGAKLGFETFGQKQPFS